MWCQQNSFFFSPSVFDSFTFSRYRSFSFPPFRSSIHPVRFNRIYFYVCVTWKNVTACPDIWKKSEERVVLKFRLWLLTDYFLFQYQCHFVSCDDSTCSRWVGVVKHDIHQMRRDSSVLLLLPGPIFFYFISSLWRRYDVVTRTIWFSCCGQWNGPLIFFQKLNGLEWTAVCRQGARAFVFFFFFREIVNQVPTAFPIVRVNKASSFFFFSFHRLILIFGRAGLVAHRLLCCCCCCL